MDNLHWSSRTAKLGRSFLLACKAFPILFPMVCLAGIIVGAGLFIFPQGSSLLQVLERIIGPCCIFFYSVLLLFFIHRWMIGKWGASCDTGCAAFADNAEWRQDLTAIEPHYDGPVHTGIEVRRLRELFACKRSLQVFVDGFEVVALRFGSCRQLHIDPGPHEVWVQMDWCRSKSICVDIHRDQLTQLKCAMRFRYLFPFNMALMVVRPTECFFIEKARDQDTLASPEP
jgi:hypothetical protein